MAISLEKVEKEKKSRIFVMVFINLIPILCLIAVCIFKLVESTQIRKDAMKGRDSAENFLRLDALIQDLQYERGFALAYLRVSGQGILSSVYRSGQNTSDEALDKAEWPESSLIPAYINSKGKFRDYLANMRKRIMDLEATMPGIVSNYTSMLDDLTSATEKSITVPERGKVWKMVAVAGFLLRASDPVGNLLSIARTFFFTCSYSTLDYARYLHFEGERQVMLRQATLLDDMLSKNYTKRIKNVQDIGIDLDYVRQLLINGQFETECLKFTEDERRGFQFKWTQDFGGYWVELRTLRDNYVANIVEKLNSIAFDAENEMIIYILVVFVVTLVCALIAIWQARSVYNLMATLVGHARTSSVMTSKIGEEKAKGDTLLYEMVPVSVAADMKQGKDVSAQFFSHATICYIDLVGFVALITKLKPIQVTNLLNELYSMFDKTMQLRDVHKIEQSNDVTCVVSGVPDENENHADEIASFVTELLRNIKKFEMTGMPGVQIRCRAGVHSGPCAAGIVGHTSVRYSIFGETVKMASRMSRTGEVQRIQISSATKNILASKYPKKYSMEQRGKIDVYGIGRVTTYFLNHKTHLKNGTVDPPPSEYLDEKL